MNSIGIRVTPKTTYFTVIQNKDGELEILTTDKINAPKSMDVPDKLSFIRTTLISISHEYNIANACIRKMEQISRNISIERANIEGVIQELISTCSIEKYTSVDLSGLAKSLGIKSTELNNCIKCETNIYDITNWDKYKLEERESILCAISASSL